MGRYVAVDFQFENITSVAELLAPLFSSPFFTPIAMGGIEGHQQGDHWLIAGFALEYFVSFFRSRGARQAISIDVASTPNSIEQQYLASIANAITQQVDLSYQLSPFEIEAPETGVTFISAANLGTAALDSIDQWLGQYPRGVIYLYGTVQIAVQSLHGIDWSQAFRFLYTPDDQVPVLGAPFLFLRVGASPFTANKTEVGLYSASTIWLESSQALDGRVGQREADTNLVQLAALARLIAQNGASRPLDVELNVEGSLFHKERERIESAFAGVLQSSDQ